MSKARFSITYDGTALSTGVMDVQNLAPALLAVGQLFDAANFTLSGEQTSIKVNVTATGSGSFEVFLQVVQPYFQKVARLFVGENITAALNLKELLFGDRGIIWLIKKLRGGNPTSIEYLANDRIRIVVNGESFEVPINLLRLYETIPVRDALEKLIGTPLREDGVDTFRVGDDKHRETVTKEEARYFSHTVAEEILVNVTIRAAFTIVALAFKGNNKWRLHDGNSVIHALILDETFLHRVNSSQIAFSKGDVLICDVKKTQTRGKDGLKTEYVVEKVVEHKPAIREFQMALPIKFESDEAKKGIS